MPETRAASSSEVLLSTGLAPLDLLMGGGIPARQALLIAGQPGSGKTILASQIAFAQAARGVPVLLATAASEPHTKILESLQGFSFFNRERVGREIFLLSAYPWLRKGVRESREMLLSSVRERKARLLIIDGLRSLRDVWRDESHIREFLAEVGVGLASNDCTGVFTIESAPETILEMPEAATVDGVLTLGFERIGMRRERRFEVVKVRGRRHLSGMHSARLGPDGFSLWPRVESRADFSRPPPVMSGRSAFGISALDTWLGGGLPKGSVSVLAGEPGTGKSLLSAAFAAEGVRRGEPSLFISMQESRDHLVRRAQGICLDLEALDAATMWSPPPVGLDPDEFAEIASTRADALGAKRIVIDGLDMIQEHVLPEGRRQDYVTALAHCLREGGRDLLLTTDLLSQEVPLSRSADTLLELRRVARDGVTYRELQAVKVRAAAAPRQSWRFLISSSGCEDAGEVRGR